MVKIAIFIKYTLTLVLIMREMSLEEKLRIKIGISHSATGTNNQSQDIKQLKSGTFYTFEATVTDAERRKGINYDIRGYIKFNKMEDGNYEYLAILYSPLKAEVIAGWTRKDVKFHSVELLVYGVLMSYIMGATNIRERLDLRKNLRTHDKVIDNLLQIPIHDELFGVDEYGNAA